MHRIAVPLLIAVGLVSFADPAPGPEAATAPRIAGVDGHEVRAPDATAAWSRLRQRRGVRRTNNLRLTPCPIPDTDEQMLCGSMEVYEDRQSRTGRKISLAIAVLPALAAPARPDPVFYLAGGPGGSATARAAAFSSSWMRADRDIVMVDQRGTGGSNPLFCRLRGGPDDVQGYTLTGFDQPEQLAACRDELGTIADLRHYGTEEAVDDIDDVRAAMGYEQINLYGLSWGSRSGLVYLRRHGSTVRRAVLSGIVPLALLYSLYHAHDTDYSLGLLLDECAQDAACSSAFPQLDQELQSVVDRLEQAPVEVTVQHPDTGLPAVVELDRVAFVEWIRWFISSRLATRWFPAYVHAAYVGNYQPVAQDLVETTQFYNQRLAMGELMSVVCPEDVARIDPADIPALTDGTIMGDTRVRQVLASCAIWPGGVVSPGYGDPVVSDVPTLLWSGTLDPRCPPYWGEVAAQGLTQSLNLVVPDAHGVAGPCIDSISEDFLDSASPLQVDTSCIASIELPPFEIP